VTEGLPGFFFLEVFDETAGRALQRYQPTVPFLPDIGLILLLLPSCIAVQNINTRTSFYMSFWNMYSPSIRQEARVEGQNACALGG